MKTQQLSQIRAKIGRCHLHSKKKSSYSITLKMGSKAVASTQYKISKNQQIDFNCELSLQVDRHLLEGPGKLSIIVNMLTEEKQKKVVGSVFANLKEIGMQIYKVSQCSCKDKGFQVQISFQVVNIQNLNNNHNNNKFHSPNQSEMKDLKNALTVSRQKQIAKNFKGKKLSAAKSPIQKTEAKVKTSRNQKQFQSQISMSLNQSQLTKIIPSKQSEESKQIMTNLKDQIKKLQNKLKLSRDQLIEKQKYQKTLNKQIEIMQKSVQQIRNENVCLLELLKIEEEKNSAAIQYIQYMSNYVNIAISQQSNKKLYLKLIGNICQNSISKSFYQQQLQISIGQSKQYSFGNKTIQEKEQLEQINVQLAQELELYKIDNINLKKELQYLIINKQIKNVELQEVKQKIITLQGEKHHSEIHVSSLTQELQKLKSDHQTLIKDFRNLQQRNIQIQKKNSELSRELSQLKTRFSKNQSENLTIKKELLEAVSRYKKLQQANQTLKQQIINLKKALQSKQFQIQRLNKMLQNEKLKFKQYDKPKQNHYFSQDKIEIQQNIRHIQMLIPDSSNNEMTISRRSAFQDFNQFQQNKSLLSQLRQVSQIKPQQEELYQAEKQKKSKVSKQRSTQAENSEVQDGSAAVVQKYNYNYDVDSVNYFNNFNDNHVDIEDSLVQNGEVDEATQKYQ